MQRYGVSQFDTETFVVIDRVMNREVCLCGNYQGWTDAEKRARQIASSLNRQSTQNVTSNRSRSERIRGRGK